MEKEKENIKKMQSCWEDSCFESPNYDRCPRYIEDFLKKLRELPEDMVGEKEDKNFESQKKEANEYADREKKLEESQDEFYFEQKLKEEKFLLQEKINNARLKRQQMKQKQISQALLQEHHEQMLYLETEHRKVGSSWYLHRNEKRRNEHKNRQLKYLHTYGFNKIIKQSYRGVKEVEQSLKKCQELNNFCHTLIMKSEPEKAMKEWKLNDLLVDVKHALLKAKIHMNGIKSTAFSTVRTVHGL
jgi:hypothetical protein